MQLWNRNLDPADKVEIVRAVANLTVEESGRDTARDSGWPELIEELKNDEGPFGQRLRAEATRARHNLSRKGTYIYPDGVTVMNAPEEVRGVPIVWIWQITSVLNRVLLVSFRMRHRQ